MVATFVRLKLSVLGGGLRASVQQAIAVVAAAALALPAATALAAWLATAPGDRGTATFALVGGVAALGWALAPVLSFTTDETLDPARLRSAPLPRRTLATGLLAASAVGVAPVATALVLAGAAVGAARGGGALTAAVTGVALVAQVALCLLAGRLVVTALAGLLRSRRGRDLGILAIATLGPLAAVSSQVAVRADLSLRPEHVAWAAETLRPIPIVWAPNAAAAAADGRALAALGWLAATAVLLAVVAAVWMRVLEHSLTDGVGAAVTRSSAELYPRGLRWLPATPTTAACARELRSYAAEPQRRLSLLLVVIVPAAGLAVGVVAATTGTPTLPAGAVLVPVGVSALVGLQSLNGFAADRGGVWLPIVAGRLRTELAGKHLASAILAVPAVLVASAGVALGAGGWHLVPLAGVGALLVLGPLLGVGAISSVLAPWPLPRSAAGVTGGAQGQGCAMAVLQAVAMLAMALVAAPAVAGGALALLAGGAWVAVAAVAVPAYAAGVWVAGLSAGSVLAGRHREHLLATLSR